MKGLVQRHPETREKMAKYAVEAAWQLAQWDDIGGAADWAAAPAKDWSVALANLLKCVHTEDRDGAVVSVGRLRALCLFTRECTAQHGIRPGPHGRVWRSKYSNIRPRFQLTPSETDENECNLTLNASALEISYL